MPNHTCSSLHHCVVLVLGTLWSVWRGKRGREEREECNNKNNLCGVMTKLNFISLGFSRGWCLVHEEELHFSSPPAHAG